jgi:N-acetylmuramoyl-L-alanine amidase CwlA
MPAWKGIVGRNFRPDQFRDYVGTQSFSSWRPQFIVVHNTANPRFDQWHSVSGQHRMLNLESYYRDQQQWSAGPHLFVADDFIWVFTSLTMTGVHSPSWNGISWGVEIVGNYQDEPFGAAVRENAVDALAVLHAVRGISPDTLKFHKEDPKTTHKDCPGKNIDKADLIQRVHDRMNTETGEHVAVAGT